MSEYQYYEFRAIDRPLTEAQRADVSGLSSRAHVTSHVASFVYNYGDFRGNPEQLMAAYFDAMLYMTNWGTRRLIFRLPAAVIDSQSVARYCISEEIDRRMTPDRQHLLIDFEFHDEELMGWTEGEGWLDELVDLRRELLCGDFRGLYLAWLKAAEWTQGRGDVDDEIVEPPVPAGLGDLSSSLKAFAKFLDIDEDLIAVAAQASEQSTPSEHYDEWVERLPVAEQHDFLTRLSRGESHLSVRLNTRLAQLASEAQSQPTSPHAARRTISQLLESSRTWRESRVQKERRQAELQRQSELDALAPRQAQVWQEIQSLIDEKKATAYDRAVTLLKDLHALARYQGNIEAFKHRLYQLQQRYPTRSALLRRIRDAKLLS